jgi:hypothetical protein
MKNIVVISILCATVAVVACRREVRHEPLKLGASDVRVSQPSR